MALNTREDRIAGIIALVLVLVLLGVVVLGRLDQHQLREDLQESREDAQALAVQVENLGGDPVVEPGEIGPEGPQGPPGEDGEDGRDGLDGEDGEDGVDGAQGEPGATGEAGEPGEPGPPGATGDPGPTGAAGEPGPAGPQGPAGATGPAGQDGQDVESFTFQWGGVTYTCTDPESDGSFTCDPGLDPSP